MTEGHPEDFFLRGVVISKIKAYLIQITIHKLFLTFHRLKVLEASKLKRIETFCRKLNLKQSTALGGMIVGPGWGILSTCVGNPSAHSPNLL